MESKSMVILPNYQFSIPESELKKSNDNNDYIGKKQKQVQTIAR